MHSELVSHRSNRMTLCDNPAHGVHYCLHCKRNLQQFFEVLDLIVLFVFSLMPLQEDRVQRVEKLLKHPEILTKLVKNKHSVKPSKENIMYHSLHQEEPLVNHHHIS